MLSQFGISYWHMIFNYFSLNLTSRVVVYLKVFLKLFMVQFEFHFLKVNICRWCTIVYAFKSCGLWFNVVLTKMMVSTAYVVIEKRQLTDRGVNFKNTFYNFFSRGGCVCVLSHDDMQPSSAVGKEQVHMEMENWNECGWEKVRSPPPSPSE